MENTTPILIPKLSVPQLAAVISEQAKPKHKIQTAHFRSNFRRMAWKPRLELQNRGSESSDKHLCNIRVDIFALVQPDVEKSYF